MQVNQPTIKACVADILPKQGVQVPESVTQSMDNALSQKDELDVKELQKYESNMVKEKINAKAKNVKELRGKS
ncbi:hypothetical protein Tco_1451648 [Tanacetum coccineum]